jgi:hypothetical protein
MSTKMSMNMKYGLGLLGTAVVLGVAAAVMGDGDGEDEKPSNGSSGSGGNGNCTEVTDRTTHHRGVQYTVDACRGSDGKLTYYGVILLPMQPRLRLEQGRVDGPTALADAKAWIDAKHGGGAQPGTSHADVCQHLAKLVAEEMAADGHPLTEAQKAAGIANCIAEATADPARFAAMAPCLLKATTFGEAAACMTQVNQPMTATFAGARR